MEASVDLSSPKKRPAYRPMWEQAERELAAVRALLETERTTSRYYWRNLKGFRSEERRVGEECR